MSYVWDIAGQRVEQGEKWNGTIKLADVAAEIPIVLIHGNSEGPSTVILGGIHGCEYTSIDAAIRLSRLEPHEIHGRLAVIPVVNIPAYSARSIYLHPEDKKNLNRVFPGKKDGTAAEILAYQITETFLRSCDFLIDLHGGDMNEALVPFILYHQTDDTELNNRASAFAKAFGIKYVISSKTGGSTYEATASMGKVAVLPEAGQQGILDPEGSKLLVEGSLNALRSVGVIDGEVTFHAGIQELKEFLWARSKYFGAWYPMIQVGETVESGQKVGELRNLHGELIEDIFAQSSGTILFCVTSLAINPEDPLFAVGN